MTTTRRPLRLTRDLGLYLLGIAILVHQTLVAGPDANATLVVAAISLCFGTPLVFRTEELLRRKDNGT